MASTRDILDQHLKAFDQGDVDAGLSDYAPDVVFFARGEAFKGVDAIRPLFETLIVEFRQSGATFKLKQQLVEDDYAYIFWTAETTDNFYELATDTFVVREGRIVASHSPLRLRRRIKKTCIGLERSGTPLFRPFVRLYSPKRSSPRKNMNGTHRFFRLGVRVFTIGPQP